MRKLMLFALLPLAVLASCGREIAGDMQGSEGCSISATIEAAGSRVQLSQGVKTLWEGTEEISVFGASGGHYRYATEDSGATATFKACPDVTVEESILTGDSYVLYPYRSNNNKQGSNGLVTSIASQQTGAIGDYGSQKPLLVGRVSKEGKVTFKHASTVVRVNIVSESITAVTFKTNGGEPVAGAVTVDYDGASVNVAANGADTEVTMLPPADASSFAPGDYYFIIAPGTFGGGFTLSWEPVAAGFTSSRSYTKPFTALPGHILNCGELEYVKEAEFYQAPEWNNADILADYEWYEQLTTKQKAFMLPHILTSFINSEWYKSENFIYVIAGEIADAEDCESIGEKNDGSSHIHATAGYNHIRAVAPFATVKSSGGEWSYFEAYLQSHPDNNYCISLASDYLGGDDRAQLKENPEYESLKRILGNSNVMISCASNNKLNWNNTRVTYILNEDSIEENEGVYRSGSVNSSLNNKICVPGYDPDRDHLFGWNGDCDSCRPIGFGKEKHNIVMPMFNLNYDTASSFSTAMLSGTLGNFLSILMKTHPGVTLEGANTILQDNYLREEKFKYVDDADGSIKEGGEWYFFDTDKFFENEVMQKETVDAALKEIAGLAGNDAVALPSGGGLCYMGPGVQFEAGGTRLDMTEENRAAFETAWKADPASVKWYFSPARAAEYGATGSTEFTIRVLDTQARLIPDLSRTVTVIL